MPKNTLCQHTAGFSLVDASFSKHFSPTAMQRNRNIDSGLSRVSLCKNLLFQTTRNVSAEHPLVALKTHPCKAFLALTDSLITFKNKKQAGGWWIPCTSPCSRQSWQPLTAPTCTWGDAPVLMTPAMLCQKILSLHLKLSSKKYSKVHCCA